MDFKNDNFEKENQFTELTEEEINASTVFSKPNIEHIEKPKKANRLMRIVIPLVAILVVFGLSLFLNAKFGGNKATSDNSSASEISSGVKIIDLKAEDIKSIEFKNNSLEASFYPSGSGEDLAWYIKNIKEEYIDIEGTGNLISDIIGAVAVMEKDVNEKTDYGFDKPTATAKIIKNDGKEILMEISKEFATGNIKGAYVRTSDKKDKVYIITDTLLRYYSWDMSYFMNSVMPTAIEENKDNSKYFVEELTGFDYFKFSGDIVAEDYQFEMYGRENSQIKFKMTSPYVYNANEDRVGEFFTFAKNDLEAYGILEFNNDGLTDSQIKKYGLDKPSAEIEYKVGKDIVNIKLALMNGEEKSGSFAAIINDVPIIYEVGKSSFSFLSYDYSKFVSSELLMENIAGIDYIEFMIGNKNYRFNSYTKEAEDDESEEIAFKYDGKNIDSEIFTEYYYRALSISAYTSANSVIPKKPNRAEKYLSITIHHNKQIADEDITLTIYKLGDNSRYYAEVNGNGVGEVNPTLPDLIYSDIDKVITNSQLTAIE